MRTPIKPGTEIYKLELGQRPREIIRFALFIETGNNLFAKAVLF